MGMLGENENCLFLGVLEADTVEQVEMKEKKIRKENKTNEKISWNQAL